MDNLFGPDSAVVVRYGYCVYNGRSDPHTACHCCDSGAGTYHSRPETPVDLENPAWNGCGPVGRYPDPGRARFVAEMKLYLQEANGQ